ncbi:MAG: STAS-like domain-containing protein [Candidatus Nitronauta litoralis]|uniref:STAS-like domain-containing protein n=1 Tax=Candidatus Nitronauta litoralis TaxID=2705533 RepID=A0A7T0FZB0_9BACT|nr:MAG: STAS-like domain-containing protein [Candidatus Nitronauta litoralis]
MEKEITIKLFEIVKTNLPQGRESTADQVGGNVVREIIEDAWEKYEKVMISFDNIVKMTRTFSDEAFGKLLENHSLEEFNQKVYFPDAKESIVQELNAAMKLRMKIIASAREREKDELGI